MSRIFTTSFASVYPHYVTKVEKKGRTKAELDQVIEWLTGFDESTLSDHLDAGTTFEGFFTVARLNPHASLITGVVCGVRVEDVDDPLMRKIRYLDVLSFQPINLQRSSSRFGMLMSRLSPHASGRSEMWRVGLHPGAWRDWGLCGCRD